MQQCNVKANNNNVVIVKCTAASILDIKDTDINIPENTNGIVIMFPSCRRIIGRHNVAVNISKKIITKITTSQIKNNTVKNKYELIINEKPYMIIMATPEEQFKETLSALSDHILTIV